MSQAREALSPAEVQVIRDALRFADWAAGEGISPVAGQPAGDPAEFLSAYTDATGDDDWASLPDRIMARAEPIAREALALLDSEKGEGRETIPLSGSGKGSQTVGGVGSAPAQDGSVAAARGVALGSASPSPGPSHLDALRASLDDDATNLGVSLIEACLSNGLGFRGPWERFGELTHALVMDALWSARRDGAQFATEQHRASPDPQPDPPAGDELREALARTIGYARALRAAQVPKGTGEEWQRFSWFRSAEEAAAEWCRPDYDAADAILALPSLTDLLTAHRRAEEAGRERDEARADVGDLSARHAKLFEAAAYHQERATALQAEVEALTTRVGAALDDMIRPSAMKLMAGEMTAQEARTAYAVAKGIAFKVRNLLLPSKATP